MLENLSLSMRGHAAGFITLPQDRRVETVGADSRQFTIIQEKELSALLSKEGWSIARSGYLPATNRTKTWKWYIVSMNK